MAQGPGSGPMLSISSHGCCLLLQTTWLAIWLEDSVLQMRLFLPCPWQVWAWVTTKPRDCCWWWCAFLQSDLVRAPGTIIGMHCTPSFGLEVDHTRAGGASSSGPGVHLKVCWAEFTAEGWGLKWQLRWGPEQVPNDLGETTSWKLEILVSGI